LCCTNIAGSDR